jgi:hypothetical protein
MTPTFLARYPALRFLCPTTPFCRAVTDSRVLSSFLKAGLSGSSAIVCAALSCLLDFYNVRDKIRVEVRPNLILDAEKELGIVAGLQDRVAQVYCGLVYMVRQICVIGGSYIIKHPSTSIT